MTDRGASPVATATSAADLTAAVVAEVATILATALGLGDEARPSDDWPVGEGDALVATTLTGDVDGVVVLAVNAEVAGRLVNGGGELPAAMQAAADRIAAAAGVAVAVGVIGVEELVAPPADRPAAVVEILDAGRLTSLVGLTLRSVAGLADEALGASGAETAAAVDARYYEPESFDRDGWQPRATAARGPLSVLADVEMIVTAELGRTTMPMRELLGLTPGMVVEIDRAAGAPIDLLVNGRRIASGEVVVIDEEFGIRVTEICPTSEPS